MPASQEVLHLRLVAVCYDIPEVEDPGHIPGVVAQPRTLAHRHNHQNRISGVAPDFAVRYCTSDCSAAFVHHHRLHCSSRRLYGWLNQNSSSWGDCLAAHDRHLRGYEGFVEADTIAFYSGRTTLGVVGWRSDSVRAWLRPDGSY